MAEDHQGYISNFPSWEKTLRQNSLSEASYLAYMSRVQTLMVRNPTWQDSEANSHTTSTVQEAEGSECFWHPPFYAVGTQIQGMVGPTLEWAFSSQ